MEEWVDRPLSNEELDNLRTKLAKMSDRDLAAEYNTCLELCQLHRGQPPRAPFVQQLVQAWRELARRSKERR